MFFLLLASYKLTSNSPPQTHYYMSHPQINPTRIVVSGLLNSLRAEPFADLDSAAGRSYPSHRAPLNDPRKQGIASHSDTSRQLSLQGSILYRSALLIPGRRERRTTISYTRAYRSVLARNLSL
jgi:hypothetical protein